MKKIFSAYQISGLALLSCSASLLGGCVLTNSEQPQLTEMESIALCRSDEQAIQAEKKITAEYGFKRFAEGTYRPVLDHYLFGHEIRVIELGEKSNKIYAAGNPREFGHHFGWLLKEVTCEAGSCQALITENQTLHIKKVNLKKAKDTTVIECTKPVANNDKINEKGE